MRMLNLRLKVAVSWFTALVVSSFVFSPFAQAITLDQLKAAEQGKVLGATIVTPTLPTGITSNGDGTYSGTVMKTTLNSSNFPGLFGNPILKTVKASGGDYTTLQAAFNGIATDAPNCNEIIQVDSGYTAATLASNQNLVYNYTCPANTWVWVRPSGYGSLPPQGQTICTTSIANAVANGQTITFTTSRNHLLTAGMTVRVKGMNNLDFNGDYIVTSVPSPTTFTVANTTATPNASSAGGTVIPVDLYLNPSACPDIPNMFTVAKTGGNTYDLGLVITDDAYKQSTESISGPSASGLIVSGMQMAISPGATVFYGILSGTNASLTANYVNHIIIDRSYIYSPAGTNLVNGIAIQGPFHAVVDSYIDGVKDTSNNYAETHGIDIPFANGPYKIVNNYVGSGPSEFILSGGGPVTITDAIPTDIEVRKNTLYADYFHQANSHTRKNFIEFKASKRLLVDGNTLEYSWQNNGGGGSQYGAAMIQNTLNQDPQQRATWNTNQDQTYTNNDIQHFGSNFFSIPGRGCCNGNGGGPTYPLNNRSLLSNNVFRDWNQQTYNLSLGGSVAAGFANGPGYYDATHLPSGADNTTLLHNGIYGSPGNNDVFGLYGNLFLPLGTCPGAYDPTQRSTSIIPAPDLTVHANITVIDGEYNYGDCQNTFDGFNSIPGLMVNVNWSGNVHVQNGSGPVAFAPTDFTTAGPDNQFPNGGASGVAPAGMFNNYTACTSVPAGPLTSCALQATSTYKNTSYCDGADCGPNIPAIEAAQISDNDGGSTPPPPPTAPVISSFTASPSAITSGSSSTLSWSVSNASSTSISSIGDVSGLSSKSVFPTSNITYTLTAANPAGSVTASVTVTVTAPVDTTPPLLSSIQTSNMSTSTAVISWVTDEPATSFVDYGLTTSYGSTAGNSALSTSHSVTLSGLSSASTYHFRVRSADSSSNQSASIDFAFSTAVDVNPNTDTPPAAIQNLSAIAPSRTSVKLNWTAPGNDGNIGTASSYDIRYSTSPITDDSSWSAATQVSGEPAPQLAGTSQSYTVVGLQQGVRYYFAIKTTDTTGNLSPLSNDPYAITKVKGKR